MHDDDRNLEELDRLLGGTKDAYRTLRHERALPSASQPPVRRLRWRTGHTAVAASLLIAAIVTASLLATTPMASDDYAYRFAMPSQVPAPLSLRPAITSRPALSGDRSRLSLRSRLPSRPAKTKG